MSRIVTLTLALSVFASPGWATEPAERAPITLPDLDQSVRVRWDESGVPHIFSRSELDAATVLGYLHAQDRFFQMDVLRRTFSGTLAGLLGAAALPQDVQLRTLGLHRAAAETIAVLDPSTIAWLEAYASGVNALVASSPLPPEYSALELTAASVPVWTALDSVVVAKGLAFGLAFDLSDLDYTAAQLSFQATGGALGFDGLALFSEDTYRHAPFDPTLSIPESASREPAPAPSRAPAASYLGAGTLRLIEGYRGRADEAPVLRRAFERSEHREGSNWFVASGAVTEDGSPLLANDPHLALDAPATFYEVHYRVGRDQGPALNVSGVSFPGVPAVALGCNPWICWGATVNPMDVTDVYQEVLVVDPGLGLPTHTLFEGQPEPLVAIPESYGVNQVGNGVPDDLVDAGLGPLEGGITLVVPRRNNGPIVQVDFSDPQQPIAFSVQYTGWRATRELEAFLGFSQARDLDDFRSALQHFDVGSQNFSYADVEGNIAYFTSAEMPLREDLQGLDAPDGGIPPWIVRDGTHTLAHEWMPLTDPDPGQSLAYEILPFEEMPQVVNPARGFVLSANADPIGTTLDNNPLNQLRPGGGLYYLSPGYASGYRAGRIERLLLHALDGGGRLSTDDFASIQANNQLLDAEVLVPYLLAAFDAASNPDADPVLGAVAARPGVSEAISRLAAWDWSTPTGVAEGWDPGDDPEALEPPSQVEIDASVSATIYAVWRGQAVQRVIDGTLAPLGLADFAPGSSVAVAAFRHHLDVFPSSGGVGASGLDFFSVPGVDDPAVKRDLVLLESLADALDLLASETFDAAFGSSTDQGTYRWGALHRIVFDHPLGPPFSLPPAGGLADYDPAAGLFGVARAGGFGAVDASAHGARADGVNEFMFGSGPARRFVGRLAPEGPVAQEVVPGGASGVLGSPQQADQLRLWLTNRYHPLFVRPDDVKDATASFQRFEPPPTP